MDIVCTCLRADDGGVYGYTAPFSLRQLVGNDPGVRALATLIDPTLLVDHGALKLELSTWIDAGEVGRVVERAHVFAVPGRAPLDLDLDQPGTTDVDDPGVRAAVDVAAPTLRRALSALTAFCLAQRSVPPGGVVGQVNVHWEP